MYGHHFQRNIIKFILIYFPKFDKIIHEVIMYKKDPARSYKCKTSIYFLLKHITFLNQHRFTIQHMAQNLITDILINNNTN